MNNQSDEERVEFSGGGPPNVSMRSAVLILVVIGIAFACYWGGFNTSQILSVSVFSSAVLATLLFWQFRLAIAFLGIGVLLITRTIDVEHFVLFSSLDVISFLIAMMVIVGMLKEIGFFNWLILRLVALSRNSARRFVVLICLSSALLACLVDEVTSIIFIVSIVLEMSDHYRVDPVPLVISSVLATNIGSAGTMLGNPIGILIGMRAGFTFEDFVRWSLPIMLVCLLVTILVILIWYRKDVGLLQKGMLSESKDEGASRSWDGVFKQKEYKIGVSIFVGTIALIAMHYRLELLFGFSKNSLLLAAPIMGAGITMVWKREKARYYIERSVDWWTLLFFLMLFAKAGTLKYTGATDVIAKDLTRLAGHSFVSLLSMVTWTACIGSSVLDNVVLVSAMIPMVQSIAQLGFDPFPLWWALLFGGCFGGNITMVGSTANIVALGMLEKEKKYSMPFLRWLWIGLTTGLLITGVSELLLILLRTLMP